MLTAARAEFVLPHAAVVEARVEAAAGIQSRQGKVIARVAQVLGQAADDDLAIRLNRDAAGLVGSPVGERVKIEVDQRPADGAESEISRTGEVELQDGEIIAAVERVVCRAGDDDRAIGSNGYRRRAIGVHAAGIAKEDVSAAERAVLRAVAVEACDDEVASEAAECAADDDDLPIGRDRDRVRFIEPQRLQIDAVPPLNELSTPPSAR